MEQAAYAAPGIDGASARVGSSAAVVGGLDLTMDMDALEDDLMGQVDTWAERA